MSGIADIAVVVESLPADRLSGNVLALLHEIADLMQRLVATGETGAIDLRGLPLLPGEREVLQTVLGEGEVRAVIDALGESTITETRLDGVWWVTHRDREGAIIAETLEVTPLPAILRTDPRDVRTALQVLREQLDEWAGADPAGEGMP